MAPALRGKGNCYKRGGVWVTAVEGARDPKTGKRKKVWLSGFATRKEAEQARDAIRDELRRGVNINPGKVTVGELVDRWLATRVRLADSTRHRYEGLIRLNIKPYIGQLRILHVRPAHLQQLYVDLLTSGGGKDKEGKPKPLSSTTVRHVHALLQTTFAWAVRMQLLARSPVAAMADDDLPKRTRSTAEALTDKELERLAAAAAGTRWDPIISLALATGMRRGEIAALLWGDVDFDRAQLTVRASLTDVKGDVKRKATKTDNVRSIPLSAPAIAALRQRRAQYVEEKLLRRPDFVDSGYVFSDEFGRPYPPLQITMAFREIAREAQVRRTFHDLRHTAASLLLSNGADARTVASILGHSSPTTTLTVYAHVIAGRKEAAVEALGAHLQAATSKK